MKSKKNLIIVVLTGSIIVFLLWVFFASTPLMPKPRPEPPSDKTNIASTVEVKAVSLPKLVKYYEEQLDPRIPRITITVEQDNASWNLPYDASVETAGAKADEEYNDTWFVNLMNNFWSLPKLRDDALRMGQPAHFVINFSELPVEDVIVFDYKIYDEHGYVTTYYSPENPENESIKNHMKMFTVNDGSISFDLWVFEGLEATSNPPPLLGLRLLCHYEGETVEYYLMFQYAHPQSGFLPTTDLSHLTPLKE